MKTTLKRLDRSSAIDCLCTNTCDTISAADRLRGSPSFPVRQNWQARAHPICDETQNVNRF